MTKQYIIDNLSSKHKFNVLTLPTILNFFVINLLFDYYQLNSTLKIIVLSCYVSLVLILEFLARVIKALKVHTHLEIDENLKLKIK